MATLNPDGPIDAKLGLVACRRRDDQDQRTAPRRFRAAASRPRPRRLWPWLPGHGPHVPDHRLLESHRQVPQLADQLHALGEQEPSRPVTRSGDIPERWPTRLFSPLGWLPMGDECGAGRPIPSSLTPHSSRRSSSFRSCERVPTRASSSEARCGGSRRSDSGARAGLHGSFSSSWSAPATLSSCSFGGRRRCMSPAPSFFMGRCSHCSLRDPRGAIPDVAVRASSPGSRSRDIPERWPRRGDGRCAGAAYDPKRGTA